MQGNSCECVCGSLQLRRTEKRERKTDRNNATLNACILPLQLDDRRAVEFVHKLAKLYVNNCIAMTFKIPVKKKRVGNQIRVSTIFEIVH